MIEGFNVNCVAPTLLAQGKRASSSELGCHSATIIQMTHQLPPLGKIAWVGCYPYRCSKAALNMAMKNMSIDLKKDWNPYGMGGSNAMISVEECVSNM
ncbi:C-factor, partial [Caligus rogercresseyi]